MHQLEQNGERRARLVNRLHARTDRLLSTILLGNNLVNILSSALATSVLITLFGDVGIVYATLGMTFLVVMFGEILPKTLAFRRANKVALLVAPTITGLIRCFRPSPARSTCWCARSSAALSAAAAVRVWGPPRRNCAGRSNCTPRKAASFATSARCCTASSILAK